MASRDNEPIPTPPIDFAIITTLDDELDAVKETLNLKNYTTKNALIYYYGYIDGISVICVKSNDRGNISSANTTNAVIQEWRPSYLLLVGYAGGIKDNDRAGIKLGDVVVSDSIVYYEYKKIVGGQIRYRELPINQPSVFLKNVISSIDNNWWEQIKITRPSNDTCNPKVIRGLILSGESIINDPNKLSKLLNRYDKAVAIETEAGGVAKAVYDKPRDHTTEYMVIKGVSDYANSPNAEEREQWKRYASYAAAAFTLALIKKVRELLPRQAQGQEQVRLLEYMAQYFTEPNKIDGKPLSEYYVESNAVIMPINTWSKSYKDIKIDKYTSWNIEDFLNDPSQGIVVIGAEFGTGKTSYARYITHLYANRCLNNGSDYFPILVKLRSGLNNVYGTRGLDYVLNIVTNDGQNKDRKILLILDGLDEYKGEIRELIERINSYQGEYRNMKVIITTRLKEDYANELNIENYVRLLPLSEEQVDQLFKKYNPNLDLTFNRCINEYYLNKGVIRNPLFCWMLAYMHANQYEKLEFKKGWSTNMIRTLLYHSFIHSILLGKYVEEVRSLEEKDIKKRIAEEKRLLRLTAALVNLYGEISKSELRDKLSRLGVNESYLNELFRKEGFLEYFLTSYFYMQEERIEFIHDSFKEYCLAEYYYESIKEGKWWRLNVGMPSEETIDFLKGLVEILKNYENVKNISISPIIKYDDINILKNNAKQFVESEELLVTNAEITDREIWKHIKLTKYDYEHLWLYRWISLSMLKWLDPEEEISKEKLIKLVKLTSHFIPYYLKNLQKVDLSRIWGINLHLANLVLADLSEANLTSTNLFMANLYATNLYKANLYMANLSRTNLFWANLSEANLTEATLCEADLTYADLKFANLSGADLSGAKIIGINSKGVKVNDKTKTTNIIIVDDFYDKNEIKKPLII
jgi:5'-methylthioadenosine/S-adenosylhomocysteine nucleosidase